MLPSFCLSVAGLCSKFALSMTVCFAVFLRLTEMLVGLWKHCKCLEFTNSALGVWNCNCQELVSFFMLRIMSPSPIPTRNCHQWEVALPLPFAKYEEIYSGFVLVLPYSLDATHRTQWIVTSVTIWISLELFFIILCSCDDITFHIKLQKIHSPILRTQLNLKIKILFYHKKPFPFFRNFPFLWNLRFSLYFPLNFFWRRLSCMRIYIIRLVFPIKYVTLCVGSVTYH